MLCIVREVYSYDGSWGASPNNVSNEYKILGFVCDNEIDKAKQWIEDHAEAEDKLPYGTLVCKQVKDFKWSGDLENQVYKSRIEGSKYGDDDEITTTYKIVKVNNL